MDFKVSEDIYQRQENEFFKIDRGRVRATLVSELWVGGGNTTFRANREGVFAGANNYTNAPFKVDYSGILNASGANISGAITATSLDLTGDLTAGSDTGQQLVIKGVDGEINFDYAGDTKASMYANSAGNLIIDADGLIYIQADGAGDDIYISAGDNFVVGSNSVSIIADNNIAIVGDDIGLFFNDDNDNSDLIFYSNSSQVASLNQDGDFDCDGDVQCGGTFRSSDGSGGETEEGFTVMVWIDWDDFYTHDFTFKDGILTSISGEDSHSW